MDNIFKNNLVIIDLNCNMHYSAFYIEGLKNIFGKNITYSSKEFKGVDKEKRCFLFMIKNKNTTYNYAIDFHDARKIDTNVLIWSHTYAKINLHNKISYELLKTSISDSKINIDFEWKKVVSIPPSFGVQAFNLAETVSHITKVIINNKINSFLKVKKVIMDNIRMYVKRLPLNYYYYKPSMPNYVFLIASIWHKNTDFVNYNRANFIRVCKNNNKINFEGGFIDIGFDCDYIEDIEKLKVGKVKIKLNEYIRKTQNSNFVFNCPSVEYCHGWKLGEYLCMGKAIISTKLSNEIPTLLEHGKNIHFIEEGESLENTIKYLIENQDYVKKLELGAKEYWEKYCTPEIVISYLITKIDL